MTKQFTRLQLFSLTDGRLSTKMDDVFDMLNHIYNEEFQDISLGIAWQQLKELNPQWFKNEVEAVNQIKTDLQTNDFETLIEYITSHNVLVDVPQIGD